MEIKENKSNKLTQYVPPREWQNDKVQQLIYEKLTNRLDMIESMFKQVVCNSFILDCDEEGIERWEKEFNVKPYPDMTLDDRKAKLISILRGIGVTNVDRLKNIAKSYECGDIDVIQNYDQYSFIVKFVSLLGIPKRLDDLKQAIEKVKPAHLGVSYKFKYNTWDDIKKAGFTWDYCKQHNITWEDLRTKDLSTL